MKVIYLTFCCFFLVLQVQAKKLKICLPKKVNSELNTIEGAGISFGKTFAQLKEQKDEIYFPGNFSTDLDLEGVIRGHVSASNTRISGITNITLCIFPTLTSPFNITMNALKIEIENCKLQGEISDLFDIFGDGKFEINLDRISFAATDLFPSWPLGCVTVDMKMKLQNMKADFDNIMGGDPLLQPIMNTVMGDLVPDAIDYYYPIIYNEIEPYIQKIIDKYVNKNELENLFKLVLNNEEMLLKDKKKQCFDL